MKNLVFPRIFLHCVALGFIVSGLLLSVGSEVQILSGTPESTAASLFSGFAAFFVPPSPGNFTFVTGRFLYAAWCIFANWTRTLFRNLLRKFCVLLIRFFGLLCRGLRRYQGCERTRQLRRLLKLLHKAFKVQGRRFRFCRFLRRTDIAKIRLGIEGCLEFLSIDLSILVQNVSIWYRLDSSAASFYPCP